MSRAGLPLLLVCLVAPLGCLSRPKGETVAEKRAYVREMRDDVFKEFFAADPALRKRVQSAAGYGAFSNTGIKIMVLGTGHGYGLVHDNATGKETFMRVSELGGGVGMGVKNFRALFVFQTQAALRSFLDTGLAVGGKAEASAMAQDVGASTGAQTGVSSAGVSGGASGKAGGITKQSLGAGVEVYQLTKTGVALEAMVSGTKYWKDPELN
jgi:lipid-binding SYLF domain-containing protein